MFEFFTLVGALLHQIGGWAYKMNGGWMFCNFGGLITLGYYCCTIALHNCPPSVQEKCL